MEILAQVLRLVPVVLIFFVPALFGLATWKEKGRGYRVKTALWFGIGFGVVVSVQVLFRSADALQVLGVIGISIAEIAVALALAFFTVYRLAD